MRRTAQLAAAACLVATGLWVHPRGASAGDKKSAAKGDPLGPKAGGDKVFEGRTADGLVYAWRGPRRYDAAKGVGVTVILHGSNLDHRWAFANHDPKTFRPDDLVLAPDGTTPAAQGGFNFLHDAKDTQRLHALLEEARKAFKVRATYLYGHSQGSFFTFQYAGEYPDEVDGFVAHASGIWTWSKVGAEGRHQAIVLMHGTQDPVVPYAQSEGGLKALREQGYPTARLYPLEGWNHWPAEANSATPHTSQELAWVEGMTTKDAERLEACLDVLVDVRSKEEHDWAGLWSLAKRAEAAAFATDAVKARAGKAIAVVEALAARHAKALADVKPGAAADGRPWMAHLPLFLRQFDGVPGCVELAAKWKDAIREQEAKGSAHYDAWWQKKEKDVPAAFDEGVAAVAEGFLWSRTEDRYTESQWGPSLEVVLKGWQKDAKRLKLSKRALRDFAVVEMIDPAWKKGWDAYAEICRSAGDL